MTSITIEEINKFSKDKKSAASEILKESDLIETLSKYGKVNIVGSYSYNLMIENDIDIYVENKEMNLEMVVDVSNEIFKQEYFYFVSLNNHVKFPQEGFPKGYYLGLKHKVYDPKWKIDIWLLASLEGQDFEEKKHLDNSLKSISQEDRNKILKLKYISYINEIRLKHKIRSVDIYNSVLNNNIETIEKYFKPFDSQVQEN